MSYINWILVSGILTCFKIKVLPCQQLSWKAKDQTRSLSMCYCFRGSQLLVIFVVELVISSI